MITDSRRHVFTLGIAAALTLAGCLRAPRLFAQSAHKTTLLHVASARATGALPDSSEVTVDMIDAGRAVFHGAGTCFACHGDHLQGGPVAPTLMPHAWRDAKDGVYANIYYVVTHGVPGTAMVSHPAGISDAQAVLVASYVWAVSHGHAKP